ncbi:MAG: YceI family protein [Nocardiopsaceae bacterium]|jgi:polyisoprenoid-binding protein YceI|nr:YceI family protein [Nocardiopsaceae bacterium]
MTTTVSPAAALVAPPPGTYRVDPRRSGVSFTTTHLFGLPVHGRFEVGGAEIRIGDPLAESAAWAVIPAASFATSNPARDSSVRSGRFLAASAFPDITFASDRVDLADGHWVARGMLTVRGTSRPVDVHIEEARAEGGSLRLQATARIDRVLSGVTASRGLAGRYLRLQLDIVAERA